MMRTGQRIGFLGGLAAATLFAAWQIYRRRARERVVSHEALDDPAIARAFGLVARLPQMGLLRRLVARRAAAMDRATHPRRPSPALSDPTARGRTREPTHRTRLPVR